MKKLISSLTLALGAALSVSATQYTFENFSVVAYDQSAAPWATVLNAQLGVFSAGFAPTALNLTDWSAHWISPAAGYYDPSGPEWNVNLALGDNADFAVGQQLYLWAFDDQVGVGSQWSLFTDASWLMAANDGLDPTTYFLGFTANTSAAFGSFDAGAGTAGTQVVTNTAAVPDSLPVGGAVGGCVLLLATLRRRMFSTGLQVG